MANPAQGSPLIPLPFEEAIAWAKGRGVVLPDVYYGELQGLARAMAFSVAGLASMDQLQMVRDSLAKATENGESLQSWQKRVEAWEIPLDLPAHRLDNLFRTNLQGHYARGRCQQHRENLETHPWFLYDAVNDSRTRPAHAAMDGFVARHDDPVWKKWAAPNGYRCRCRLIALSEAQAARFRTADQRRQADPAIAQARMDALGNGPDAGWDYSVCEEPTEGVRRAEERKRDGSSDLLFSAFQSRQRRMTDPIMRVVDFAGFDDLNEVISLVALRKPHWFPDGFKGIFAVSNNEFFAAIKSGSIFISNSESIDFAFSPARDLVGALNAIRRDGVLTLNQEYAVEVLQHELIHSAHPRKESQRHLIGIDDMDEAIVQLVARLRYPALLSALGGETRHSEKILTDGYSYYQSTRNFVELMRVAGLTVEDFERSLRETSPKKALQVILRKRTGWNEKKAGGLLNMAMIKPLDSFLAKIRQVQAYAQPQDNE